MLTLNECQHMINDAVQVIDIPQLPVNLYDPVRYVLQTGGKRIRPALVIMACNAYMEDVKHAIHPALALELFHNFTLLHDDIMDNSKIRRNRATVHIKWNTNIGILSGDAMLIKSYELLSKVRPKYLSQLLALFNRTAIDVCEGQQLDMDYEEKDEILLDEYLKMIELKTSVLIGTALKTGAILGGAGENDANLFYEFGKNMGIAFQFQDDLLDLYADPVKFGKHKGNDIVSNKKTILLVQAMHMASGSIKKELKSWLNKKTFDRETKIRTISAIFDDLKIKEQTLQRIRNCHRKAMTYLDNVSLEKSRKAELNHVARMLLNRKY